MLRIALMGMTIGPIMENYVFITYFKSWSQGSLSLEPELWENMVSIPAPGSQVSLPTLWTDKFKY